VTRHVVWLVVLLVGPWAVGYARAAGCPTPGAFVIPRDELPRTAAAVGRQSLTILALGGSATLGQAAHGAAYTYPARLEARLGAALPGVSVRVVVLASPRHSDSGFDSKLATELALQHPALVIWGPGASSAAAGGDLDTFSDRLSATLAQIHDANADTILMTLQYAPSLARLLNLEPYRTAVVLSGAAADVAVFDRYELMRFWSDSGFMDLDVTNSKDRVFVARKLYDCMAEILTRGIVDAVK
jgi:acyl-CoA thioesterase I